MAKSAAVSIRIAAPLKAQLELRAKRERRSLTAQITHDLERSLSNEEPAPGRGRLLGLLKGTRVPTDQEIHEARAALWGRLSQSRSHG